MGGRLSHFPEPLGSSYQLCLDRAPEETYKWERGTLPWLPLSLNRQTFYSLHRSSQKCSCSDYNLSSDSGQPVTKAYGELIGEDIKHFWDDFRHCEFLPQALTCEIDHMKNMPQDQRVSRQVFTLSIQNAHPHFKLQVKCWMEIQILKKREKPFTIEGKRLKQASTSNTSFAFSI